MSEVFEFRGVDNLVFAEVTKDDNETDGGYVTGEVKLLSHVAEIGKTTEASSEAKYYDNKPLLTIDSEGADEITLTVTPLDIEVLSEITGKGYDVTTGMFVDGERVKKYFALGYRTKGTDGGYRYVWRLKGTFNIPDETVATEDDGTDSNNQELTFTGISTTKVFQKGKFIDDKWEPASVKGIVIDARKGLADVSTFFDTVQTPDTIKAKAQG